MTLPLGLVLNESDPYTWVVSARNERGVTTESAAEFMIVCTFTISELIGGLRR